MCLTMDVISSWMASNRLLLNTCNMLYYSSGPRTEPWGTPKGAGTQRDLDEPRTTQFERSVKKDVSQSRGWSTKPKEVERRCKRMEWSTESKAELTSKRARRVT